ncbi:transposase [Rhodococcus globerulus]|uniref:transposase n=1 Tax=Rhodococcus globerulus TaxID=33008 RepID=UPI00374E83A4
MYLRCCTLRRTSNIGASRQLQLRPRLPSSVPQSRCSTTVHIESAETSTNCSWTLRHPDSLTDDEQIGLKQVLASCPYLEATAGHVASFAGILTEHLGKHLNSWMTAVSADDLPHLYRFVRGLDTDHAAVLNGLTLPYSSGAVEGHVNRIKMLKRQMYGRAGFDPPPQTNTPQQLILSK